MARSPSTPEQFRPETPREPGTTAAGAPACAARRPGRCPRAARLAPVARAVRSCTCTSIENSGQVCVLGCLALGAVLVLPRAPQRGPRGVPDHVAGDVINDDAVRRSTPSVLPSKRLPRERLKVAPVAPARCALAVDHVAHSAPLAGLMSSEITLMAGRPRGIEFDHPGALAGLRVVTKAAGPPPPVQLNLGKSGAGVGRDPELLDGGPVPWQMNAPAMLRARVVQGAPTRT
jgi:hypothetical protein